MVQKEPGERRQHRCACKHYSYGYCCARSGWMGAGIHITAGCDGNCQRMSAFDRKHGLTGPFKIES